jgi:hypothetical protein
MIKKNKSCKICDSKNIKKILRFKNFPLTGIFTKNKNQKANTFNLNLEDFLQISPFYFLA